MRPVPMFISAILLTGIACTDSRPPQTGQIDDSMAAMVSDTKPTPRSLRLKDSLAASVRDTKPTPRAAQLKTSRVPSDTKPTPKAFKGAVPERCDSIPRPKDCPPDIRIKAEVKDTKPTP
jgi:hypothetical protein